MSFGESSFTTSTLPTSAPDDAPASTTSPTTASNSAAAHAARNGAHPQSPRKPRSTAANPAANGHAPARPKPAESAKRAAARATSHQRGARKNALETLAALRTEVCEHYRPEVAAGAAPIRVMARMVQEIIRQARERGLPEDAIATAVVNRTIGDVDLRRVSPIDDGPEFVSLADDMGLALPGEMIGGQRATGKTYRWIHQRMLQNERALLARGFDLRMYDLLGVGNAILLESGLSFLGLGIQPPSPSWGNMIAGGRDLLVMAPWVALVPGLALVLTVLATSLLGDAWRDRLAGARRAA